MDNTQGPGAPQEAFPGPQYTPGQPLASQSVPGEKRDVRVRLGIALLAIALLIGGYAVGGEPRRFISVGLQFIPLALLASLAYGGLKNTTSAVFAYISLAILALGLVFLSITFTVFGVIKDFDTLLRWETNPRGIPLSDVFRPEAGQAIAWAVLLLSIATMLAASMLFRPVRVFVSRFLPIDPDNFVHKIALSILTLLTLSFFIPLIVLNGKPPLLTIATASNFSNLPGANGANDDLTTRPVDLIYQLVWMVPAGFVAAGWPVARRFKAMLERVGFVRPTVLQVIGGVVAGVALAFVAAFFIDPGITQLWKAMGWGVTDTGAFGQLLKGVTNPLGAVLLGITAGVGEELAVRGVLQPRIGLLASNLVFTSLHALQYGTDGLLSVFLIGTILGIIRMRSNTTTSAIVHGVYDFVLVFMSYLGQ